MNRAYELARADVGTLEWGDGHNPKVVAYFRDAGNAWVKDDETAWCAAFVGAMLERSGIPGTGKLNARSYLDWGEPVALEDARPGDVVVFSRGDPKGWQGHVAFFVEEDVNSIAVLGGNQKNAVNVSNYGKARLLGIRRAPAWNKQPARDWDALDSWDDPDLPPDLDVWSAPAPATSPVEPRNAPAAPVTAPEPKPAPPPSLWQRIKRWWRRL